MVKTIIIHTIIPIIIIRKAICRIPYWQQILRVCRQSREQHSKQFMDWLKTKRQVMTDYETRYSDR